MLSDAETRRGRSFFDSEPAIKQPTGMLVHTLERCMQELHSEIDTKNLKILEVTIAYNLNAYQLFFQLMISKDDRKFFIKTN